MGPSLGHTALITGVFRVAMEFGETVDDDDDDNDSPLFVLLLADEASGRRVRLPCFELLCTNMLSEMASRDASTTLICCEMTT